MTLLTSSQGAPAANSGEMVKHQLEGGSWWASPVDKQLIIVLQHAFGTPEGQDNRACLLSNLQENNTPAMVISEFHVLLNVLPWAAGQGP
ncbi:hypothetical protein H4R33_000991, partial [Dimargaris cristalligena]